MVALNERECIVLDIGTIYCKAGLAGEPKPRAVLSYNPTYLLEGDHKYDFASYQKQSCQPFMNSKLDECPDKQKLILKRLLCELFYRYIGIDPKQKRILFVENPFTSVSFKQILAEVLFKVFKVSSVSFLLSHIAGLFTYGRMTGLVVEIGYKETSVIPIYEGRPCLFYVELVSIGGCYLDELVWRYLLTNECVVLNKDGNQKLFRDLDQDFCDNRFIVERIKCTYCNFQFGEEKCSAECDGNCNRMATIEYKEGLQLSFSLCSFHNQVTRLMSEPDFDGHSIALAICDAIIKSPRDLRLVLCKNMVFIGGCASIRGFDAVLARQVRSSFSSNAKYATFKGLAKQVRVLPSQFHPRYSVWTGGSLMGPHQLISEFTSNDFEAGERIPDWSTQTCMME